MTSTSPAAPNPHVLIIGGGFAGPVLALALANHGLRAAVYELRAAGDEQGGNIALAPNALRVLDIVGVYDALRVAGYNYDAVHLATARGAALGAFLNGSQRRYNYAALRIHRSTVRECLLRRAAEKGIPVHYGKKFARVVEEDEGTGVTVEFADGSRAQADFVVGCDGIHSKIRAHVHPDSAPVYQGVLGQMGTVFAEQLQDVLGPLGEQRSANWPVPLPRLTFGERGMFGTVPADFAGLELGFMTTQRMPEERTREEWGALEKDKPQLKRMLESAFLKDRGGAEYPPEVQLLVERANPVTLSCWPFFVVPETPTWYSATGRVLYIGDAAHAIPPTGGQGAAMAFEDAVTLALTLVRFYKPNPMPDVHTDAPLPGLLDLLARWHKHRSGRVKQVYDFTTRNGEYMKSSPMYLQQVAKEWALWASLKVAGPEAGASWLYGYHVENVLGALAS